MTEMLSFTHPMWLWLGAGALMLVGELVLGTEWLLWPAVSAGVVASLAAVGLAFPIEQQLALFAVLTVATTFTGRSLLRRRRADGQDVNEHLALPGQVGEVTHAITDGRGRVRVDGAEWRADLDGGGDLPAGACVEVVERLDGARLRVRAR